MRKYKLPNSQVFIDRRSRLALVIIIVALVSVPAFGESLHDAVAAGDISKVRTLLEAGTPVDIADQDGLTPLAVASFEGNLEIARILIAAGADINARSKNGGTPLLWATNNGHKELVQFLVDHGANIATESGGYTALHMAAAAGNTDLLAVLLRNGANIKAKNPAGLTPLHLAAALGHLPAVELLLANGAPIDEGDSGNATPLHQAAYGGRTDVVRFLVEKGAATTIKAVDGNTARDLAQKNGHHDIVAYLDERTGRTTGISPNTIADICRKLRTLGYNISEETIDESTILATAQTFQKDWGFPADSKLSPRLLEELSAAEPIVETKEVSPGVYHASSDKERLIGKLDLNSGLHARMDDSPMFREVTHRFQGDIVEFVVARTEGPDSRIISAAHLDHSLLGKDRKKLAEAGPVRLDGRGFVAGGNAKSGWVKVNTVGMLREPESGKILEVDILGVSFWVNMGGRSWLAFHVNNIAENGKSSSNFETGIEQFGEAENRPFIIIHGRKLTPRVTSLEQITFGD